MKSTKLLSAILILSAGLGTGCKEETVIATTFTELDDCIFSKLYDSKTCEIAFYNAKKASDLEVTYKTQNACFADYGDRACHRVAIESQSISYAPVMAGYLVTNQSNSIRSRALYRKKNDYSNFKTANNIRTSSVFEIGIPLEIPKSAFNSTTNALTTTDTTADISPKKTAR